MGVIQHGRGEAEDALASMEAALASNPNAPAPLLYRGLLLEAFGRTQEALDSYTKVIQLQPNMVEAPQSRQPAGQDGPPQPRAGRFRKRPHPQAGFRPALFNRGTALEFLERFEEALSCYDRALALQPGHMDAMGNRGTTLRALKRSTEALAAFERMLAAQPNNAMTHYNRGVTLMDLNRVEEALGAFDRALTIDFRAGGGAWQSRHGAERAGPGRGSAQGL